MNTEIISIKQIHPEQQPSDKKSTIRKSKRASISTRNNTEQVNNNWILTSRYVFI